MDTIKANIKNRPIKGRYNFSQLVNAIVKECQENKDLVKMENAWDEIIEGAYKREKGPGYTRICTEVKRIVPYTIYMSFKYGGINRTAYSKLPSTNSSYSYQFHQDLLNEVEKQKLLSISSEMNRLIKEIRIIYDSIEKELKKIPYLTCQHLYDYRKDWFEIYVKKVLGKDLRDVYEKSLTSSVDLNPMIDKLKYLESYLSGK